jgi:hypothetical protein
VRRDLKNLLVGDVQIGVLFVGMSAPFFEQFLIVLGFEMLATQRTIGCTHGLLLSTGGGGKSR